MPALARNDENARPERNGEGPPDGARFGFRKKQLAQQPQPAPLAAPAAAAPIDANPAEALGLEALLQECLGEPLGTLQKLKALKLSASKYDFKVRIEEAEVQLGRFRDAVAALQQGRSELLRRVEPLEGLLETSASHAALAAQLGEQLASCRQQSREEGLRAQELERRLLAEQRQREVDVGMMSSKARLVDSLEAQLRAAQQAAEDLQGRLSASEATASDLRQRLAEAEDGRRADSERQSQELAEQLEQLRQKHVEDMSQACTESRQASETAQQRYRALEQASQEIKQNLLQEHSEVLATTQRKHLFEVNQARSESRVALDAAGQRYQALEQASQETERKIRQEHADVLATMQQKHLEELSQARTESRDASDTAEHRYQSLEKTFQETERNLRQEHDKELATMEQKHMEEMEQASSESRHALDKAQKTYDALEQSSKELLEKVRLEHKEALAILQQKHGEEMRQSCTGSRDALDQAQKRYHALEQSSHDAQEKIRHEHKEAMAALQQKHKEAVDDLMRRGREAEASHAAEAVRLRSAADADLEAERDRIRRHEEQLRAWETRHAALEADLEDSRLRHSRCLGDLEQTHAERARELESQLALRGAEATASRRRETDLEALVARERGRAAELEAAASDAAARAVEQAERLSEARRSADDLAAELAQWKARHATETEARASAAAQVAASQEREGSLAQRLRTREAELQEQLASSRAQEAAGASALRAAEGKASDLEARLAAAEAARDDAARACEALRREQAAQEGSAQAQGSALRATLAEREASLRQKDEDLRESLQSIKQMHRDHSEQLQFERERGGKLERQVEDLKTEAKAAARSAEVEREKLEAVRRQAAEAEAAHERASLEAERLAAQAAAGDEELRGLEAKRELLRGEMAALRASYEAEQERSKALAREKHEVELQFHSYREHHGSSNQQQMAAITDLKLTVDKLTTQVETTQDELHAQVRRAASDKDHTDALESRLRQADATRRELHNAIQELKGNIRVFCRVRPPPADQESALHVQEEGQVAVHQGGERLAFSFDKVFGTETSQADVFDEVSGLVQSALDGYKVCIFAYGQTGSGKTFTMQGPEHDPQSFGVIPRALELIFQASQDLRSQGWSWSIHASFLEVYNEALRDLLRPGDGASQPHLIRQDEAWGASVTNLTTVEVGTAEQIRSLVARAAKHRAVGGTAMNSESSRSHSAFMLFLRGTNAELNSELHGALHLVDLAGSERLAKSDATGERLKETQNINRSLSSLADVFLAKAEGRSHVPFRNSKLTQLLEPCLSGQGKTLMLVNVAPEVEHTHETVCSLRFAAQVSQCDTGGKPKRNARTLAGAAGTAPGGYGGAGAPRSAAAAATRSPPQRRQLQSPAARRGMR